MCPHCLGASCIHCHDVAATHQPRKPLLCAEDRLSLAADCERQLKNRRKRSNLTNEARQALELMPLRPLRFADVCTPPTPPPAPKPRHYSAGFSATVLPASFTAALSRFHNRTVPTPS